MAAGFPQLARIAFPGGLNSISFSPDGIRLAAAHVIGDVSICDLAHPGMFSILGRFPGTCRSVAFSPDGRILAASAVHSRLIRLWDLPSRRERAPLSGPAEGVPAVAFSPDGRVLVAGGRDGSLSLWEVDTGRRHDVVNGLGRCIWTVAFASGGWTLASGDDDRSVRMWELTPFLPRLGATGLSERIAGSHSNRKTCD
jgi:WD40 repeat protein